MDLLKSLGEKIKNLRQIRKLTQEQLADLADTHFTYISEIECGKANTGIIVLSKIAKALNIELSELLKDIPDSGKPQDNKALLKYEWMQLIDNIQDPEDLKELIPVVRGIIGWRIGKP